MGTYVGSSREWKKETTRATEHFQKKVGEECARF